MDIVPADPQARPLSREEAVALLNGPILLRLGFADAAGWPVVHVVWHLFEDDRFRLAIHRASRKAALLRRDPRVYFTVDTGSGGEPVRGVRGRARARVIDGDVDLAVDVTRKTLRKYLGTDSGEIAEGLLGLARSGEASVVELTPTRFAAWAY
jgi:hypothetical protein